MEEQIIRDAITHYHEYVRSTFQLVVTWYGFFITANLVAAGWFADKDRLRPGPVFKTVVIGFIGANFLSIVAMFLVNCVIHKYYSMVEKLLGVVYKETDVNPIVDLNPIPKTEYQIVLCFLVITFCFVIGAWIFGWLHAKK